MFIIIFFSDFKSLSFRERIKEFEIKFKKLENELMLEKNKLENSKDLLIIDQNNRELTEATVNSKTDLDKKTNKIHFSNPTIHDSRVKKSQTTAIFVLCY